MTKKQYRDKSIIKRRMLMILGILLLLFFSLVGRLSYVMIVKSHDYKNIATDQWTSEVKIEARRGKILDRNGHELAVSANVYRIDLDMNALRAAQHKGKTNEISDDEVANEISKALNMDKEEILKILQKRLPSGLPMGSATLKRRIEKEEADNARNIKVRGKKLRGVIVSPDTKRYYPNDNFLSQVLGHTRSDGEGLTGVELEYNKYLSGVPGVKIAETDNKSQDLPYTISEYTKPVPGKDVVLTIDEMIQHFAEKAADQAIKDNKAKAVTVMVMDPKTGEILAMANKPDYNPNSPWEEGKTFAELQQKWRNRAVSDTFEPGSIFKVITASAAMQEKVIDEENYRVTCNGGIKVADRIRHCAKKSGHGLETFPDIIKNSCNVGFIDVGRKLGAEKLNKHIYKFGFGKKTGIDLPGEASGIVKKTEKIGEGDLASISFGQANTVTCIQYMTALNAIANGGYLIKPHIAKEIVYYDENNNKVVDKSFDNLINEKKRIEDEDVMTRLRGYMERVVSEGGGRKAFIDGYKIAGKTGTAQKVVNGRYGAGKYIGSFASMAPSNDPKVTVLVSIDEPDSSNYYGGQIAAPVAKQLYTDIFNYLSLKGGSGEKLVAKNAVVPEVRGLKKDKAVKILKEAKLNCDLDTKGDYIVDMTPKPGYAINEGGKVILYTGSAENYNKEVAVPNLKGYSKEKAQQLLKSLGIQVKFIGEGAVLEQSIAPGKSVNRGTATIVLTLRDVGD
ncbi:stage V sporulation protein D [Clostridium botulinum]|uniref:Stage V sporulation protein D n=1 Tax=Clostridium botulinum D str. 1873 TaxID=592027 RepID=A0A9P2G685_CLOBO|nr:MULTISPECIES: stage V sporulation protein D [Clostridium]MBO3441926.1 stage V sporulation protein D [Clostridium haemolyticum]MCD3244414.1 stage V sporulation protein D [Clostridium botulinum C]AYF54979.1 stage V sporulation protein D [Clostridium novyi]EES90681.1 stage V sporulation protein D [Clostridium botulinum D str. 1873]MCD3260972.1 stage V sporulation protein D [Clostridium botulinum C]